MIRHIVTGCLLAVLFMPDRVFGSHAMGTDITYECLGNNQYRITVAFYRDCAGINAPSTISISYFSPSCNIPAGTYSQTLNQQSSQEVSPLCPSQLINSTCNGGSFPGVQQFVYSGVITLPAGCTDWIVGYTECCRNNAVTNLVTASSFNLYAFATINNANGLCDNSPIFTTLPVPYICAGIPFNYNHGAVDIDGDSLVYRMVQPSDGYNIPIGYTGSYNVNYPLSTTSGSFSFDPNTGQMTFTPNIQQVAVITILVEEYRNGVLIGTTMRDIQVVVINPNLCTNTPPSIVNIGNMTGGGFIDSNTIQMCPNSQLTFDINVTDSNGDNVNLSSNASTAIPGATFTVIGSGPSVTGRFSWFPAVADSGLHLFHVTYLDNGCPVSTPQTFVFSIFVFNRVVASADQVYCGLPIQLDAIGGTFFQWSPTQGLSNPNIHNPIATPSVPTKYFVTSDCGVDSVFVDVQPPYTLNAGRDTSICLNSLVQLNAAVSNPNYGPFSYTWTPLTGLSSTIVHNPIASPPSTTTYYLTSSSAQGCLRSDTITVGISGVAPSVTAYADPDTVCPGETLQLSLTTAPTVCGVAVVPCSNSSQTYTLGTGGTYTATGTPFRGYWEDGRVQYLYRASELNAMGISGGAITELAFNVGLKTSTFPFNSFTIRIGCTNLSEFPGTSTTTNFAPGMAIVYGPVSYTTTAGWNNFQLTSQYDWDGLSNLIVEVCFDNVNYSNDDQVYYSTTVYRSVAHDFDDAMNGCNLSSPLMSMNRPNIRFGVCQRSANNAVISWSPANVVDNPAIAFPKAELTGTTTFIVDVSEGGCIGQGYVTVLVDTTVTIVAGPDTSLCLPTPIQLNSNATGTPSPIQLNCGVNGTPVSTPVVRTVGVGISVTSNPTPFKGNFHDGRMQMLFQKSELEASNMERGIFTSIAFQVAFKNSTQSFSGFTIKMGCTNQDVIGNTFHPNLEVVFNPKNITTTAGWNTFTFDNPYDWDGFSNVLVEVCFDNNGYSGDDIISYTSTPFTSGLYAAADFLSGCTLSSPTTTASRPNVRFGISAPPQGVFTYSWLPATALSDPNIQNPIANPTDTTIYVVTVTDGTCFATDTVDVLFYTTYNVNVYGQNLGCNGTSDGNAVSVPIGGEPPYSFLWNTNQTNFGVLTDTLFNLSAGTYSITVTDNNNCQASDSVVITVPPPLTVALTSKNINCFGGNSGTALAVGGGGTVPYNYLWSNGDTTPLADTLTAGTYTVTLTDRSGCTIVDSTPVTEPSEIIVTTTVVDASCYGYTDGTGTVNAAGGTPPYNYLWSDSQITPTATGLSAGTYAVTVTDDSNCVAVNSATVGQPDSFSITITTTDVTCFNGSDGTAAASVLGDTVNYTFLWNLQPAQSTAHATGLSAGSVSVAVTDSFGCTINSSANVAGPADIILASVTNDASCFGAADGDASVRVSSGGTGPFSYLWNNNAPDSNTTGLTAGDYYVTVTDFNNCTKVDTITIDEPGVLALNLDNTIPASCFGSSDGILLVSATGGTSPYNYLWSDSQMMPVAANLAAGTYSVTVTDLNGCTDSLNSLLINEPTTITFTYSVLQPCEGEASGSISLNANGGTPPYEYSIDGSAPQTNENFIGLTEGTYLVTIIDQQQCETDTSITVVAYPPVSVSFDSSEVKINLGQEIQLVPTITPANPGYQYTWDPENGLNDPNSMIPTASPVSPTTYVLNVTDLTNGCSYRDTIFIDVDNELIVVVPNVFTPDGQGDNNILKVLGISIASADFKVFNRWGEKVFETPDGTNVGWDGTYRGKPVPPDVYVYYVKAIFNDRQEKQIKGSVTILK